MIVFIRLDKVRVCKAEAIAGTLAHILPRFQLWARGEGKAVMLLRNDNHHTLGPPGFFVHLSR